MFTFSMFYIIIHICFCLFLYGNRDYRIKYIFIYLSIPMFEQPYI